MYVLITEILMLSLKILRYILQSVVLKYMTGRSLLDRFLIDIQIHVIHTNQINPEMFPHFFFFGGRYEKL
jgi:hypothetical protein